ncbi:DUF2514 family protein [Ramlibacter sp.]|uniref:DUF2514 family protein n=1 Tax=Ramlibacter sp. TaxID=1917967 RepID=UPI003D0AE6A5
MTKWVIRIAIVLVLIAAAAALVAAIHGWIDGVRKEGFKEGDRAGAARVQELWDEDRAQAQAQRIADAEASARETLRRLNRQEENQREQDRLLAVARADADRARAAADSLQLRAATYLDAAGCGARSGDSAIACIREAAAAIGDALGQCGEIARGFAAEATEARARGLKCEADYDALTLKPSTP